MNRIACRLKHLSLVLVSLGVSTSSLAQTETGLLTAFRAEYALFNGDKRVGESEFTLRYDEAKHFYVFETRAQFRGLAGLVTPRPVLERSEFVIVDGRVRPLAYTYRDGSRRGRRNLDLRFDWNSGALAIERDGATQSAALPRNAQDRASVRLELALALARSQSSGVLQVADPDVLRSYDFKREANETIDTPLGPLRAQRVVQQRAGSSRRTLTWAVPELGFQAARIEQQREDRDAVAFILESFEWLDEGLDAAAER